HVRIVLRGRDLLERKIELLGGDLRQRRRRALAELDVADIERRGVVGMDREPGVDELGVRRSGGRAAGGRLCTSRDRQVADRETDDERAAGLEERAPADRAERVAARAHSRSSEAAPIARAARLIALTMRGYVPQRQRCPFIAARISASLGSGFPSSSSAALMIIPL